MTDAYLVTCLGCHLYESRELEHIARDLKEAHDKQPGHLTALRRFEVNE